MRDLVDQLNQARSNVASTGSVNTKPLTSEQFVTRTAQKALARLGYGPLKADGVAGPGTRRAVEAFQRANTLPITGERDAPTLQRLPPSRRGNLADLVRSICYDIRRLLMARSSTPRSILPDFTILTMARKYPPGFLIRLSPAFLAASSS